MSLILLLGVPFAGGVLAWYSEQISNTLPRKVAVFTLIVEAVILAMILVYAPGSSPLSVMAFADNQHWISEFNTPWITHFGISFHFALDGLSVLMIILTLLTGFIAVLSSHMDLTHRFGFFQFCLLATISGVIGVFIAMDLFVFFFFWEVMLIPMVMIIGIWGGSDRHYAALKFFLFTQASSLLMLLSIIVLGVLHWIQAGFFSFDYQDLVNLPMNPVLAFWLMLGMFVAFAVKLPVVPFHGWLPDAHTEAPTAGSVLLAAILLKTGAYGMIRFLLPLFPEAVIQFSPVVIVFAVISILYGAKLAFAQTDFKRLVAYSSVSHMGFVLLGIFSFNKLALDGAVMQMIAHGLSTAGLFVIAGQIKQRFHTRDLNALSGLWVLTPRLGAVTLFFAIASLGLPGLANFVGEFLTLIGTFQVHPVAAAFAALGMLLAAIYSLYMFQKIFWGKLHVKTEPKPQAQDITGSEISGLLVLILLVIVMGFYPQPVFDGAGQALADSLRFIQQASLSTIGQLP